MTVDPQTQANFEALKAAFGGEQNLINKLTVSGPTPFSLGQYDQKHHESVGMIITPTINTRQSDPNNRRSSIRVALFGKTAERIAPHIMKGTILSAEGKLSARSWSDNDSGTHYRVECRGSEVHILRSQMWANQEDDSSSSSAPASAAPSVPQATIPGV